MDSSSGVGQRKVTLILNGISKKKKYFFTKILPALNSVAHVDVRETRSHNDAVILSSQAVDEGVDAILAAGGDGTLHQVINGVLLGREEKKNLPAIGLIPIGSANDFARTINARRNPAVLQQLLADFNPKPIDVGRLIFQDASHHYFINIADTGMGPEVARRVNGGNKPLGSDAAYYMAILKTFTTYKPTEITVTTESWTWTGKVRTLAIANGKCFGHGLYVAPNALPDDGLFSVFIGGNISVVDFIRYSGKLKKGKMISHPEILYRTARQLTITSPHRLMVEADGELLNPLPVKAEVLEKRLPFLW
jgi:diacylglycerol kinase (ATP)